MAPPEKVENEQLNYKDLMQKLQYNGAPEMFPHKSNEFEMQLNLNKELQKLQDQQQLNI